MTEPGPPDGPGPGDGQNGDDGRSQEDVRRERSRDQVRLIVNAFAAEGIDIGFGNDNGPVDDPADFGYLYRQQTILVLEESLDEVQRFLEGQGGRGEIEGQAVGVVRLRLRDEVRLHEMLAGLDNALGRGVATPEHVLYVTPGAGSCCPATEPEIPTTTAPYPPVTSAPTAGRGVVVSVVDVGWHPPAATDPVSPWLAGVTGRDEGLDLSDIPAYGGHGTFVAGVLRCLAPRATVRVEGFLVHAGAAFELDVVAEMVKGLAIQPDIISLSAGTYSYLGQELLGFKKFHDDYLSQHKDTILVAAAGNDSHDHEFWPAASDWAIGVGAVDSDGKRADFSNFGPWVDIYALGKDLVNAFPRGVFVTKEPPVGQTRDFRGAGMAKWSGTSFATPLVAGKIAAQMSRTGQTAPDAAAALLQIARGLNMPQGPP
jgi:hypothetical protein